MKRKNMTRNALFTSIISLLLCVSMLVGTTFAWFTDEVVTGMNTIAAGNLDIELLADGEKVGSGTKLFDDVTLWEPGVVVYENLQIANVGTLALKYQMTLNFGNENDLNGHKLSEVLKVAIIDKVADGTSRADVLAAAKAKVFADGALSNFYLTGKLEVGDSTAEQAIVIFWDANDNAKDNLYNANNGKVTSDGQPLHIEFGVNLQATQLMSEKDSFGNDYDESASILPKATVTKLNNTKVPVTGLDEEEINLDFALQFLPNETQAQAEASAYRYWHADFVVQADRPVQAKTIALAGYYSAFCDGFNDGKWVALTSPDDIAANTPIRLLNDGMEGISVNYEEICTFADVKGFQCGVADLTGANAGTTITVELRLYETEEPSEANGNSHNVETGNYKVIGKFNYTFGGSWINMEDGTVLFSEKEGSTQLYSVKNVNATNYTVPANVTALVGEVFAGNTNITSVTIPANVTDFGATGVSDTGASSGAFKNSSVESVVLEDGMTAIPAAAFNGAKNLKTVSIPSTVKSIGVNAFRQTALTELTIPATVTNIGYGAFRDMDSLTTVTIEGDNVTLPGYVFRDCSALRTVHLKMNSLTLNGSMNFANASSNNPGTNDITFYVENEAVAEAVKAHMGVGSHVAIYIGSELYAEIN